MTFAFALAASADTGRIGGSGAGETLDMPHIEVLPIEKNRWSVNYEGDPTPLATFETKADAIAEARNHAREFPEPIIKIYGLDTEVETMIIEPEHPGPAHPKGLGEAAF
jgi:hypothetical protein